MRVWFFSMVFLLTGCAGLMDGMRRNLHDDEPVDPPTVGGAWSERGMLREEGRSIASDGRERANGWISPDQAEANRRDHFRGADSGDDENMGPTTSTVANLAPDVKRSYKGRATKEDFIDGAGNEGSLWGSDGQTNYYFSKNKIRNVGDIVTIIVEGNLFKDTSHEIRRTLNPREREIELQDAQARLNSLGGDAKAQSKALGGAAKDTVKTTASSADRKPAEEENKEAKKATFTDIDVSPSMGLKEGDEIMAEIIERYPNGNCKLRGMKKVPYRSGYRMVNVVGVARGQDISEEDKVPSGKLYEYRLEAVR